MKKIIFVVLILMVAFAAYSQSGIIRELTGEVELKPAGASTFTPARVGSQVARDTIVSTGFRSSAVIEIGSNVITVRPLTRLTLSEIQSAGGTENLNVNLQAGRIRVDVNPPAGTRVNTTVQTPSATASVRGTSFEVDQKNVEVSHGSVAWGGSDGLVTLVSSGNSNTIQSYGSAQSPVTIVSNGVLPPPIAGSAGTDAATVVQGSSGIDLTVQFPKTPPGGNSETANGSGGPGTATGH